MAQVKFKMLKAPYCQIKNPTLEALENYVVCFTT